MTAFLLCLNLCAWSLSSSFYWIWSLIWSLSPDTNFCKMNKTMDEYHPLMFSSCVYLLGSILCSLLCPGNCRSFRATTQLYKEQLCKLSIVLNVPWLFHFKIVLELNLLFLVFDFFFLKYAAKLLQSYPTLCDPIDGSPPGSAVPGILQARTLEWVAISFSNAWKWKVKVKSFSRADS